MKTSISFIKLEKISAEEVLRDILWPYVFVLKTKHEKENQVNIIVYLDK